MVQLRAKLDIKAGLKRAKRIEKELQKAGTSTVNQLADKGKWYAKSIAPQWSGRTVDYIIVRKKQGLQNPTATIVSKNSTADRGDGFNLPRWLHTSQRAKTHIRSGRPRYMDDTQEYLEQIGAKVLQTNINQLKLN